MACVVETAEQAVDCGLKEDQQIKDEMEILTEKTELSGQNSVYSDTNGFPRANGRVLHVGLTDGEIANRVIVVGHPSRAATIAEFLTPEDPDKGLFVHASDRGFTTYTGLYEGVRVSVVAIGMGLVMMDFFIREARQIVEGPMAVVRFGTCGVLKKDAGVGSISVASKGSVLVQTNIARYGCSDQQRGAYDVSEPCLPDDNLTHLVAKKLGEAVGDDSVVEGMNATADSFYSSQGRKDKFFPDENEGLIDGILQRFPDATTMEMETFQLLYMARQCKPEGSLRAAAAAVMCANRQSGDVIAGDRLHKMESEGGLALIKALAALHL